MGSKSGAGWVCLRDPESVLITDLYEPVNYLVSPRLPVSLRLYFLPDQVEVSELFISVKELSPLATTRVVVEL